VAAQPGDGRDGVRQLAGQLEGGVADKVFGTGGGGLRDLRRGGSLFVEVGIGQPCPFGIPRQAFVRVWRGQVQADIFRCDDADL
jgi:hypothetical protein